MKKFIILSILGIFAMSCEKTDVLGEQGELTGNDYPFLTLSSIPDSRPSDTVTISSIFWAINDDISTLTVTQSGFKATTFDLNWSLDYKIDTLDQTETFSYVEALDTLFYADLQLLLVENSGVTLDTFYRTEQNAYVVRKPYIISDEYTVRELEDGEAIDALPDDVLGRVVSDLKSSIDAFQFIALNPSIDSSFFEKDGEGKLTGVITAEGQSELETFLTKDVLKSFLTKAELTDESTLTIKSVVKNQQNIEVEDESTFDILN